MKKIKKLTKKLIIATALCGLFVGQSAQAGVCQSVHQVQANNQENLYNNVIAAFNATKDFKEAVQEHLEKKPADNSDTEVHFNYFNKYIEIIDDYLNSIRNTPSLLTTIKKIHATDLFDSETIKQLSENLNLHKSSDPLKNDFDDYIAFFKKNIRSEEITEKDPASEHLNKLMIFREIKNDIIRNLSEIIQIISHGKVNPALDKPADYQETVEYWLNHYEKNHETFDFEMQSYENHVIQNKEDCKRIVNAAIKFIQQAKTKTTIWLGQSHALIGIAAVIIKKYKELPRDDIFLAFSKSLSSDTIHTTPTYHEYVKRCGFDLSKYPQGKGLVICDQHESGRGLYQFLQTIYPQHNPVTTKALIIGHTFGNTGQEEARKKTFNKTFFKDCTPIPKDKVFNRITEDTARLIPSFPKEKWGVADPFEFKPNNCAKNAVFHVIKYINDNKTKILNKLNTQ